MGRYSEVERLGRELRDNVIQHMQRNGELKITTIGSRRDNEMVKLVEVWELDADENIPIGVVICVDVENLTLKISRLGDPKHGVAARNIVRKEKVNYIPGGNSDDIVSGMKVGETPQED